MIQGVTIDNDRVRVSVLLQNSTRQLHVFPFDTVTSWSERLQVSPEEVLDELMKEVPGAGTMSEHQRTQIMEAYNAFRKVQQVHRGATGRLRSSPTSSAGSTARRSFAAGVADDRGAVPPGGRRRVGARKRFADERTGRPGPAGSLDRIESGSAPDWVC